MIFVNGTPATALRGVWFSISLKFAGDWCLGGCMEEIGYRCLVVVWRKHVANGGTVT